MRDTPVADAGPQLAVPTTVGLQLGGTGGPGLPGNSKSPNNRKDSDMQKTTAQILGAYRKELQAAGIRDEEVITTLVIEGARALLRDDQLRVKA